MSLLTSTVSFICTKCGASVNTTMEQMTEADKRRICPSCA